ncbi:hypothetical protein Drorol1_Dr00016912, partial [Drosera rotundifolia]
WLIFPIKSMGTMMKVQLSQNCPWFPPLPALLSHLPSNHPLFPLICFSPSPSRIASHQLSPHLFLSLSLRRRHRLHRRRITFHFVFLQQLGIILPVEGPMANVGVRAAGGITLRLLIDKRSNNLLYALGGKDFVDLVLHIFSLPVAAVVRLLTKEAMLGCLGDLYASYENLSDEYIEPKFMKDTLLKSSPPSCFPKSPVSIMQGSASSTCAIICRCVEVVPEAFCYNYDAYRIGETCVYCCNKMLNPPPPFRAGSCSNGYVKGSVIYMIMDDLTMKPISSQCITEILFKCNATDLSFLLEKVVHIRRNEALALLKASFETKNVLSKVFLGKESRSEYLLLVFLHCL